MAKGIDEYLERFASDPSFREQLETDFDSAVRDYDLSEEEKRELREYFQSDRHRSIRGHATLVFEEALSQATGVPSADEQSLIEERERRNREAMLGPAVEEPPAARAALAGRPQKSCLMCDEPQPSFAWFKGWRHGLCPVHRNASPAELLRRSVEIERSMHNQGL